MLKEGALVMSRYGKLALAALLASTALAVGTSGAYALRSISISESRFTLISESLVMRAGEITITCAATFTHTIARSISKREGTLAGRFTSFRVERCRAEGATFRALIFLIAERENRELWKFFYRTFTGTLPNITRIEYRLNNILVKAEVSIFGIPVACLYEGNGQYFWGFGPRERDDDEDAMRKIEGSELCPTEATIFGFFAVEPTIFVGLL
jgi:hypothetical protein